MGMVYACKNKDLSGHLVAMKVLFSEVARDAVAAARFRNEIVASYGVNHPNVTRAYEYFRDGDIIAYTMEYVGGGDMADRIGGDQQMPIPDIIRMLRQMCSGVQAIHDADITHRDLKPENILITATGDIKITDFGIAKTGTGPKLTEHGGVVGTIDYVSPEYLERGTVDARSDIYALGVMAYEMVTGESPFKGKSVIETMTMRLRSDPAAPHKLRADCSPALGGIILKAMARDVNSRYQTAAEMLRDLERPDIATATTPYESEKTRQSAQAVAQMKLAGVGGLHPELFVGTQSSAVEESPVAQTSPSTISPPPPPILKSSSSNVVAYTPSAYSSERMISVLKPEADTRDILRTRDRDLLKVGKEDPNRPHITISQGSLSSDRLKKLSTNIYGGKETTAKRFLWLGLVLVLGLVFGWILDTYHIAISNDSGSPLGITEGVDETE